MDRNELVAAMKRRLSNAHGRRLRGIVLYGSEARGEARRTATSTFSYCSPVRSIMAAIFGRTSMPSTISCSTWNAR